MSKLKVHLITCVFVCYALYELYRLEVDPRKFSSTYSKKVNVDCVQFFKFLTTTQAMEKLLPWASRLKDADARIQSVGKFYQVFFKLPIVGERNIYFMVSDYKPFEIITLESVDGFLNQRFQIRIKRYCHRTILQVTQSYGRTSAIFQYTVGMVLRHATKIHLQRSATIVEEGYKMLEHDKKFLSLT